MLPSYNRLHRSLSILFGLKFKFDRGCRFARFCFLSKVDVKWAADTVAGSVLQSRIYFQL